MGLHDQYVSECASDEAETPKSGHFGGNLLDYNPYWQGGRNMASPYADVAYKGPGSGSRFITNENCHRGKNVSTHL